MRLLGRSSKRIPTLCLQHLLSFLGKRRVGRSPKDWIDIGGLENFADSHVVVAGRLGLA